MVWNKVPYVNFHNLNQDWIIRRMMEFEEYMQNIVQISVIKYADPIQWRITGQYEQATVVIDAETGIAYISVQPVPAGVAITNTNYWTPVFDLQQILGNIDERIDNEESARIAADTTLQANIDERIDNEESARIAADTTLQANIDAETAALDSRVDALEQEILETGTIHYYPDREWLIINNQAEFNAMLNSFNKRESSIGCYIRSPGTYKFTGSDGGNFPVFNGVELHIYVESDTVTIDLNCATFYTSHLVINGVNERVRIIDTNTADTGRAFYPEGGTTFFTNCDFYTSVTVWSGACSFENCTWNDYKPGRTVCIDAVAGAFVRLQSNTFNITSFYASDDALIGAGTAASVSFSGRTTIYRPSTRSGYFFKPRRGGIAYIHWNGSAYDPLNNRSYASGNVGNLTATFSGTTYVWIIDYINDNFYYVGSENPQTHVVALPATNYPA